MAQKKDDRAGSSIKDPEMYEALRDDGASKAKAAAISPRWTEAPFVPPYAMPGSVER